MIEPVSATEQMMYCTTRIIGRIPGSITRACPQLSQIMAAAKWIAARKFLAVLS
jgi:hypothetical protein